MSRRDLDVYETPTNIALQCVKAMSEHIYMPEYATIIEPSCGSGSFIKASKAMWPLATVHGVDLRPLGLDVLKSGASKFHQVSWLDMPFWDSYTDTEVDLIIGNPPYSEAQSHIELCLDRVRDKGYVAMLLRLDFLGSKKRYDFWDKNKLRFLFPLSGRPAFVNKRTDMYDYGFFVWCKNCDKPSELMPHILISNEQGNII